MIVASTRRTGGRSHIPARWFPAIEVAVLVAAIAIGIASYWVIAVQDTEPRLLTPPLVALLLVANLIPGMAVLVLIGRRVAMRRAAASPVGGEGTLHVRLVALFSVLASVPMLLVTIFASLLFQYGVEFWFSDRARGIFENAQSLAQDSYNELLSYVDKENVALANDVRVALVDYRWPIDGGEFGTLFLQSTYQRSLSESILFSVTPTGEIRTLALVNPYERVLERDIDRASLDRLRRGRNSIVQVRGGRIQSIAVVPGTDLFVYAARSANLEQLSNRIQRTQAVLSDYRALLDRSRTLQLRFNVALLVISLLIVGLAVVVALAVADRLVRPVGALVDAARKVAGGDLAARVVEGKTRDEIGTLATAFNRMTERLQEQTGELVAANAQIDSRRALIEAVMSGVSAGVLSVGRDRTIRLANSSATALLKAGGSALVGLPLSVIAPELDQLLDGDAQDAIIQLATGGEAKTLAVRITRDDGHYILTFDDITQQLLDQRRAAWSDVARRIAHEIKNPLTPIQLAAERLQRRYGSKIAADDGTFARLTETIVRQVGDLRRMVDEFSSFARMPKPIFREESVSEIARQALFLHEVAHPHIDYTLTTPGPATLVCDRRQLGQALTNIVKNATEAVMSRLRPTERGEVAIAVFNSSESRMVIETTDNGVGLPVERDRILEPYMTTRKGGTGLGLAIVKKIVEEHFGNIAFADRATGGTIVTITLDTVILSALDGIGAVGESDFHEATSRHPMLTRSGSNS